MTGNVSSANVSHQPAPLDVAVVGTLIDVRWFGTADVTLHVGSDSFSATAQAKVVQ